MDVSVRIACRVNENGNLFSEVFFTFQDPNGGGERHALSRYPHALSDTGNARAAELAAFLKRRDRRRSDIEAGEW